MLQWYWVGFTAALDQAGIQEVQAGKLKVCIVQEAGQWHAFSRKCPHAGASFRSGWCDAGKVVCSFHRHQFDLQTGKGDAGQHNFIKIYNVKEEKGSLYIALAVKQSFWRRLFS